MRRAAAAVALATVTTAVLIGPAAAPARAQATADGAVPAAASAAWLAGLLGPDAVLVDPALGVEDVDATLDLLLGLVAADAAADVRAAVADRLAADVGVHTGTSIDATFVSATAKLTLVLDAAGRDPRDVGGTDLVALLTGRVGTDGRATDRSALGDLSTPASQALTVLALARTDADPAVVLRAADALTVAACADGGIPAEFDADPCAPDAVTTALGAAALGAAAGADPALVAARDDALAVLLGLDAAGDLDAWAAGITATALRGAGRGAEADALAAALTARLDGCEGDATAALVATADPLRGTVGTLLAASGATLVDLTAIGDTVAVALDCAAAVDGGDAAAPDAAGAADAASDPDAADAVDARDGDGPRGLTVVVAVAVLALALLAGLPVLRSARRRDAAERTGARRA